MTHQQTFATTPDELFRLLCPTAEFDWMEGWQCEMVYSMPLHQVHNAIFKTSYFDMDETWVVSCFEPNRAIEFARTSEHMSVEVGASICDNLEGTSTEIWVVNTTALTPQGNASLQIMRPEDGPIEILIDALNHDINHDTIEPLSDGIFSKQK